MNSTIASGLPTLSHMAAPGPRHDESMPDDARALVKLKCLPNHTLLGKRFGKTYGNVQKSIRALSHEALAAFLSSGSLTLDGEAFGADDILVQLEYVGEKGARDAAHDGEARFTAAERALPFHRAMHRGWIKCGHAPQVAAGPAAMRRWRWRRFGRSDHQL